MVGRNDKALQRSAQIDMLYVTPGKAVREAEYANVELARCQVDLARGAPAAAASRCQRALALYATQLGAVGRGGWSMARTRNGRAASHTTA